MIATPNKVTAAKIRRRAATNVMRSRPRHERARRNSLPRPRLRQALDTKVGCSAPVAFGITLSDAL